MKANELRIRNLIQWEDESEEIISIKSIIHDSDDEYTVKFTGGWAQLAEFKPIQLTEEWLLKFGFVKENNRQSTKHSEYFSKEIYDCKYSFSFAYFRDDWGFYHSYTDAPNDNDNNKYDFISCGIKYVHQLQNLYFALTGEELTINTEQQ